MRFHLLSLRKSVSLIKLPVNALVALCHTQYVWKYSLLGMNPSNIFLQYTSTFPSPQYFSLTS
ncbi:MAG: hypothetical protein PWP57_624, partial [Candidatus Atribacteria bacterium]|nr:hypothetical protein [Candidatus Atribacteria bacterium]